MLQITATRQNLTPVLPAGHAIPLHYSGPERRATSAALGSCLAGMLDEIDYGMLLVGADAQVLYLNHAARLELDGEHPLQMLGRGLRTQRTQDLAPLHDALAAAVRGLRRLRGLQPEQLALVVAVVVVVVAVVVVLVV